MRLTLLVLGVVLGLARTASAYPIFQFSSGSSRCSDCHYSPTGGGLLNVFGRNEAGDTISWTGNGQLLHGAWQPPEALALGGDFRVAGLGILRTEDEPQLAVFPMQGDLTARVEAGPMSFQVTGGLNGAARKRVDDARLSSYVVSREHYIQYQVGAGTPYVRLGRFFPPIGLHVADHTALVRRVVDSYTLEEPYALAAGASGEQWEFHAALFGPNPWGAGPQAYGGAGQLEWFLDDRTSLTGQTRVAYTDIDLRILAGGIAKKWLPGPRLLFAGELDAQVQRIGGAGISRFELLGYASMTRVQRGLAVGLVGQRWDPDVMLGGTARTTTELNVQLFPVAHLELHILARALWSGSIGERPDGVGLVQVHYFL